MPILTERDFAKLAATAAAALVDKQIPLNQTVDKLAAEHDMNDEQLARLCEATNNAAFNAMFEAKGKTGSADRLVEFDVAKPREILRGRTDAAKQAMHKTAAVPSYMFDAYSERRPLEYPVEQTKTAAEAAPVEEAPNPRQLERDARTLQKVAAHLEIELRAEEQKYAGALEDLGRSFRYDHIRETFPQFEKEAMALHGTAADPVLDIMRTALRLPAVVRHHSKVAHMVVADDKTLQHLLLRQAVEARAKTAAIHMTLQKIARGSDAAQ